MDKGIEDTLKLIKWVMGVLFIVINLFLAIITALIVKRMNTIEHDAKFAKELSYMTRKDTDVNAKDIEDLEEDLEKLEEKCDED